jgi:hypothetical protein
MPEQDTNTPELDLEALANEYGQDPVPAPAPVPEVDPAPAPTPDPTPDWQAKLDALTTGYEERERGYKEVIDQQNARMSSLEQLVNRGYQAAHPATPEPAVPQFTQEELLKDPIGTLEKVSDAKAKAAVVQNNEQLSGVIGGLIERSWRGELSAISSKKYYPHVKDEIEKMVEANPNLKLQPNAAELAYNMIVGRDIEKLEKLVPAGGGEGSGPTPTPTPRLVPTPTPLHTPAPVPPEGDPAPKAPELTEAQKALQAKFAGLDIGLTAADFGGEG